MPSPRLLRIFSLPSFVHPRSADAGRKSSSEGSDEAPKQRRQASEPMSIASRPWKKFRGKTACTNDLADSSPSTSILPLSSKVESPTSDVGIHEIPPPTPLPAAGPNAPLTNLSMVPHTEIMPALNPASDTLAEAWNAVNSPKNPNMSHSLNAVDDVVATTQGNIAPFTPLITEVAGTVEQSDIVKGKIDKFFEVMPVFMDALDAVKDLHPFIGVVVTTFKTVYTLEQKRRNNEKLIIDMYVEMRDMVNVLFILKDVPSSKHDKVIAPDGRNIADRLTPLIERTAHEIKDCSNICDTYAKKKLLAKVVQGPLWNSTFLDYVKRFSARRQEFEFELSIYTSRGVDMANAKLDTIGDQTKSLDEKMNVMITIFQQLASPKQKQLSELVDASGGVKDLRSNDKILLSLDEKASRVSGASSADARRTQGMTADDLREDILETPDAAAEKNRATFFRKFEVQKRQIDELKQAIEQESDRVIQELKGGPHERILDRSIREIWTEMGWYGNVKARHFVLALKDYYMEKLASEVPTARAMSDAIVDSSHNPDAWAIKLIDVMRLQPIMEAFDDDASGFITISEMNHFTSSKPDKWSLPHWIAFWAVGYRLSIIDYAKKIEELFAKMEGVHAEVLPPNRASIDDYFSVVWHFVNTLTAAVHPLEPGPDSLENFRSYLEAEEARLSKNLKEMDYIIDGTDTLTLITGVGRIEKTVFPLLYLLMKRHYEIMRIMTTKVLDPRELWVGVDTILFVQDAIRYRVGDLTYIFAQQRLDAEKHFQIFAHGIFKYFHNEKALWTVDYVRSLDPPVIPYDDVNEDQNINPKDILKFDYTDELTLGDSVYDEHSTEDIPSYGDVEPPLRDILGRWNGYFYEEMGIRLATETDTMMTVELESADGKQGIKGNGWSNRGRFTIDGSWSKGENNVMQIKFRMSFQLAFLGIVFFNGYFDPERDALTGDCSNPANMKTRRLMELRRIPPRYLTVYPSIYELSINKPRALWKFAIAAVRSDIRRERWSWSYFSQRRNDRETYMSLIFRVLFSGKPLDTEETERLRTAAQGLTPEDACFYGSRINRVRGLACSHLGVCDSCLGSISGGAQLFCLDCANKNTERFNPLNICCQPQCMCRRITHRQDLEAAHEPCHRLVKVRVTVLRRQHGRVHTAACEAFERVKGLRRKLAENLDQAQEGEVRPDAKDSDALGVGEICQNPGDASLRLPDDARTAGERSHDSEESLLGTSHDTTLGPESSSRPKDSDLPTCGKCQGRLSFPCWYCIVCKDDLFICDTCDADGVPDLMRSSGKHNEYHHLIRCLAPEDHKQTVVSTEERLGSMEDRLNCMQSRFDDLHERFDDLNDRFVNIEQLLHRLVGTVGSAA